VGIIGALAVWFTLLLLSLVVTRVVSAASCSGRRPGGGWNKGVNKDITTTVTIPSETITKSDIKAVFFLLKITIQHIPCFQDN
jgi:hypothetical protein